MKNLQDWLNYIESFHASEIELGLERVTLLAKQLELINLDAKVITVAGTNGKGSCVATLESLAIHSKLNIGCYTSPHLVEFNERIRVNGQNVNDELLLSTFKLIDQERAKLKLTFFEFTTLVALSIFKNAELDLIVLEVGLGGRLDAVNIVDPDITIITTIDKDHESWLGSDINQIAYEKSGICRENSTNYVGDLKSYQLVSAVRSEITYEFVDQVVVDHSEYQGIADIINDEAINPHRLLEQNIKLAIVAFNQLFEEAALNLELAKVIKTIEIKGRFQQVINIPKTVVDVGHNVQAAYNLSKQIKLSNCHGTRYAICGLMADKAISEFLDIMNEVIDQWFFVDLPTVRAAKASKLQGIYKQITSKNKTKNKNSVTSHITNDVVSAYKEIKSRAASQDQIYIFGSFITVAEMLHYCRKNC